ncbi:Purple acid phosphatase 4 [Diplonema papillatum]|nr:Purple acid phosphatase 4 [Diplonema papillatum]|eukprot:gene8843-13702_t
MPKNREGNALARRKVVCLVAAMLLVVVLFTAPSSRADVVFITLGDWGTGSLHQAEVAAAMASVAKSEGASFIVTLGDNFYPDGVASLDDPKFVDYFEKTYSAPSLQIPWHITLGDHDHIGDVKAQIRYTARSSRWVFPAPYYTFTKGSLMQPKVTFVVVDSVGLEGDRGAGAPSRRFADFLTPEFTNKRAGREHFAWLRGVLGLSSRADWLVAVGHRPVFTGGVRDRTATENATADALRALLINSSVDVYINGHDHTNQYITDPDKPDLHYIVNGGGGYFDLHPVVHLPTTKYAESTHGFCLHRVTKTEFVTTFYGADGKTRKTVAISRFPADKL